ncbi:Rho termination factor N-terminal domain-containing protein, partial [Nocardioides aquaticus]|uniref:Rho termination factor N-terminal domain-containing protein n=1 Tax=Nocardioides aquaticus TaxID=160826 RepID=UPI0031CDDEA5
MTETDTSATTTDAPAARKRSGGLSTMLIADLRSMAVGLGVSGAGSLKKAQLVEAIKAAQSPGPARPAAEQPEAR